MKLESRQIEQYLWDKEIIGHQMIFLSGPRQIGKTTYAKSLLQEGRKGGYFNWDNPEIRRKYMNDPFFFLNKKKDSEDFLVIFDEIHKRKKWKDILKGIYDTVDTSCRILVTGSANLELFRKSGDSLIGRYVHFHMLPVSLSEMLNKPVASLWLCSEGDWKDPWGSFVRKLRCDDLKTENKKCFDLLLKFGGFPEPLTKGSERFLFKWKRDYLSLLLTEDLRDISQIREIDTIERIIELLPQSIGSPLSINSLSRDVESSYPTVKNNIFQLEKLWLLFTLSPWSKRVNRTLRKEKKCYFTNWIYAANEASLFENMIASSLFKACVAWTDMAYGKAELRYIRNFDGREIDFIIILNNNPVLLIEAKLSNDKISRSARNFSSRLNIPIIQVLSKPAILRQDSPDALVISAEKLLQLLP